jgi:hypothetical protein
MYDRYGQWVPDNSDTTTTGVTPGMRMDEVDTSSMMPDEMDAMDGGPDSGMDMSEMDTSTMMPDRMEPLTKD